MQSQSTPFSSRMITICPLSRDGTRLVRIQTSLAAGCCRSEAIRLFGSVANGCARARLQRSHMTRSIAGGGARETLNSDGECLASRSYLRLLVGNSRLVGESRTTLSLEVRLDREGYESGTHL